jgi:hypothetical protein
MFRAIVNHVEDAYEVFLYGFGRVAMRDLPTASAAPVDSIRQQSAADLDPATAGKLALAD